MPRPCTHITFRPHHEPLTRDEPRIKIMKKLRNHASNVFGYEPLCGLGRHGGRGWKFDIYFGGPRCAKKKIGAGNDCLSYICGRANICDIAAAAFQISRQKRIVRHRADEINERRS